MPTASAVTAARDLQRSIRTLLFVDVVDYVRLIEAGEEETVRRWIDFVEEIEME